MVKLKTLNEIYQRGIGENYVKRDKLREEAIKWVKYHKEHLNVDAVKMVTYPVVCGWIMNFFNITQEDIDDKASKGR